MRQHGKRWFGILLTLALILGLMPGMSLTAYADGTTYNPASTYTGFGELITNDTEVTISEVPGKTWYYESSEIKTYVDGLTGEGQPLAGISSVISDLTLIDKNMANGLSETKRKGTGAGWWLRLPGTYDINAAFVVSEDGLVDGSGIYVREQFGVRLALKRTW
jgi:hypothetical protein